MLRLRHIMRVSVSGKQFVFPRSCACCGAYPLTELTVIGSEKNRRARTKGWTWEIPYCLKCKHHVRAAEILFLVTLALAALSVIAGFAVTVTTAGWELGLATGAGAILITSLACWIAWRVLNAKCSENCWGLTRSVIYLGSSGSCHSFDIKSAFYASDFVRANHHKVVNASPKVASILRNTSFGNYQVPRRLIGKGD
ncbi:MAG: hypothetical protein ACR2HJ_04930 [Fimbriimonadales bacterium]